jgi:predicted ATPase
VRGALARHAGVEVDTQGDAFFATFASPGACVGAAVDVQRELGTHPWPDGDAVRVRIGIHTGEASETATGLVGVDVHRAARIAAVAHGGQIVLSGTTAGALDGELPAGARLRDLGRHLLKDLGQASTLFQVEAGGLRHDFPPLRSLDNPELPNNLPHHLSTFIGREAEVAEIRALVESSRLVTLAGAGGSGKTRVALQVAADLVDAKREGVFFVDLSLVGDPGDVPAAVHSALGLVEPAGRSVLDSLLDALARQRTLIVLDNCEHVVDECAKVAELIERRSGSVHLLATSREPLGIDGEIVYRLRPLSLPPQGASTLADLEGSDAVMLFVERVRARDNTFALDDDVAELVASICRRLDGVPLALELAAARLGSMSLADLHDRLDQRFRLLVGGSRTALARQRTLQAMVDWSYDLLAPDERDVLERLSVFVGSFDLSAAETVCTDVVGDAIDVADALASLVDKSLVGHERSSDDLRYRLLDTIRQYAWDKLASHGHDAVVHTCRLHAAHYLALAELAAPALRGTGDQGRWMKRIDAEWENLRAAADHFDGSPDGTEGTLRLGAALHRWASSRSNGDLLPGLRRALEHATDVDAFVRVRGALAASWIGAVANLHSRTEVEASARLADSTVDVARSLGDRAVLAELLVLRGIQARALGEADVPGRLEEAESLATETGDPALLGLALMTAKEPEASYEQGVEVLDHLLRGGDLQNAANVLSGLGHRCLEMGDVAGATAHAREALRLTEEIGGFPEGYAGNLAVCALLQTDVDEAERAARIALVAARRRRAVLPLQGSFALWALACCATRRGDLERAARLTGAHDGLVALLDASSAPEIAVWTPLEQKERDGNRDRLRALLGDGAFARAYKEGMNLDVGVACDLALER